MPHERMNPDVRKELILDHALKIASGKGGLKKATRTAIAAKAGVSMGLVSLYFGSKEELRDAVIGHAVKHKNVDVLREAMDLGIKIPYAPRSMLRAAKGAAAARH